MPQHSPIEIESLDANGQGVRLRFVWQGDRFGHTVYHVKKGVETACLESCEGDSADIWPPSPPVQEIHAQETDGRRVLFLTGMAGTAHWSITIEAAQRVEMAEVTKPLPGPLSMERGPGRGATPRIATTKMLWFDVAVRLKSKPESLGSTYAALPPHGWIDIPPGSLQRVGNGDAGLILALQHDAAEPVTWQQPTDTTRATPVAIPNHIDSPSTLQWSYGIALASQ